MRVSKNNKIKNIISFVLAIILMFSIIIAILSSFIRFVFLNPNVYLNVFHNKKTENQIYETIQSNLKYALVVNNIPENVLDNVITEEEVRFQVNNKMQSIIIYLKTGRKEITKTNTELYLNRFNENLYKYFNDNSIQITDSLKVDVDNLEKSINQIIVNEIEIINTDLISKSSEFERVAKFTSIFYSNSYFISIIFVAIVIGVLLSIWHNNLSRALKWIGDGILAAGIIVSLVFISGYISKFYDDVIIYTSYLKEFIIEVIKQYLKYLSISGCVVLIIGVALSIIANNVKKVI